MNFFVFEIKTNNVIKNSPWHLLFFAQKKKVLVSIDNKSNPKLVQGWTQFSDTFGRKDVETLGIKLDCFVEENDFCITYKTIWSESK